MFFGVPLFFEAAHAEVAITPSFLSNKKNVNIKFKAQSLKNSSITQAELLASSLDLNDWVHVKVEDSVFINSDLRGTRALNLQIQKSVFKQIDFSGFKCKRCLIEDSAIEDSRFDGASFVSTHFRNVVFKNSNLRRTQFLFSTFENCRMDSASAQGISPQDLKAWGVQIESSP